MNQLIRCPFCQDLLKISSIEIFIGEQEMQAYWFCLTCNADVSRVYPYNRKEYNDTCKLIDTVEFVLEDEVE